MQTIEEYKEYTRQLEGEVGKWHHAYDALMVERNQLARELATWKKLADDLAKTRILDEQQRGKK
jgi:FtsZ-binding cell division protein ZapB